MGQLDPTPEDRFFARNHFALVILSLLELIYLPS
jgi:hypothetical protein